MFYHFLVARVGFEETFYRANEAGGTVEICVIVYQPNIECPIEMNFSVTFETRSETAGKYMNVHRYKHY